MEKRDLANYRRKMKNSLTDVDAAISKGAYLSAEEWFDFIFKSEYLSMTFKNIRKYKFFNRRLCNLASAYAVAFDYLVELHMNGFNNFTYILEVRNLVSFMKKFSKESRSLTVDGFDRDGVLYIRVYSGKDTALCPVRNREEAINGIKAIVRYCTELADCFPHIGEFDKFLNGYLSREFAKFRANIEPTPYVCGDDRLTLSKQLASKNRFKKADITVLNTECNRGKIISIC